MHGAYCCIKVQAVQGCAARRELEGPECVEVASTCVGISMQKSLRPAHRSYDIH